MILYTSDIERIPGKAAKTAFVYVLISLFCILFGAVYEVFSHGVDSFFMIYAFVVPFAGGTLPFLAICLFYRKNYPNAAAQKLYHSGIATLTLGSILQGVLDIYGTTNRRISFYWTAGAVLLLAGTIVFLVQICSNGKNKHK